MRSTLTIFLLLIVLFSYCQGPDMILTRGKVFTADTNLLYVEAIAITGNKVTATGKANLIEKLATAKTKMIDLKGRTVIPGINDAHYHHTAPYTNARIIGYPADGSEPSWEQVTDSVRTIAAGLSPGKMIYGWFGTDIATDTTINRVLLDRLSPRHPVILASFWGHVTILNTAAIKYFGLAENVADPKGGYFGRFPGTDIVNGRVYEMAQFYMKEGKPGNESLFASSLKELGGTALYFGITSIQNMCTGGSPSLYKKMLAQTEFPVRFRLIRWSSENSDGSLVVPDKILTSKELSSPLYTISGTKWLLEGTPLEQLAELREGYKIPSGWNGKKNYPQNDIDRFFKDALERNDQLLFHIAGDKTLELVLEIMEKQTGVNWPEKRLRVEHGDGLLPDLYARAKKLGIIIVQNPTHFSLVSILHQRYKGQMEAHAFAMKSLLAAGIPVALGSDGPINPYLNMMLACMHPYNPTEALTVEEAVISYTKISAFAEFAESDKGTLTIGKLADLAVLSQDIFTIPLPLLPATRSVLTMVDGKIVYTNEK